MYLVDASTPCVKYGTSGKLSSTHTSAEKPITLIMVLLSGNLGGNSGGEVKYSEEFE